jgi:DnaK suppressor protein
MCPIYEFETEEVEMGKPDKYYLHDEWEEIEEHLLAERRDVCEALLSAGSLPSDELTNGWQEPNSPAEDEIRDMEYGRRGLLRQRLYQIDEALERLSEGAYGLCVECGIDIDPKRLVVNPSASLCLACQSDVEEEAHRRIYEHQEQF